MRHGKTVAQRIIRFDDEGRASGMIGAAADPRDDGGAIAGARLAHQLARERASGEAAEATARAETDTAARIVERQARGNAAAGRAAIHLPFGEDAEIGAGMRRYWRHIVGDDGAVEKREVR